MHLTDRSGGVWTDLVVKRSSGDMLIKKYIVPDERLMKIISDEAISSVKGSTKHTLHVERRNGKINYHLSTAGTYSTGILKRISPDGTPYEDLHRATMNLRRWKANKGVIPSARNASYILRETSKHIFDGLKVKKIFRKFNQRISSAIGWSGEDEEIAMKQDKGIPENTVTFFTSTVDAPVPARPFRGFSDEFVQNIYNYIKNFLK